MRTRIADPNHPSLLRSHGRQGGHTDGVGVFLLIPLVPFLYVLTGGNLW